MTAIHNLMRYITIACPFIVTLLAVIIDKEAEQRRKWLGLGTALLGFLVLFLTKGENWLFWLIPGALAFVYCWQMRGLGKWLVIGWWLMICSVNLSSLLQAAKLPHYAYYGQALLLPGNLAFWTVPPLTIWYLWHNLPLALTCSAVAIDRNRHAFISKISTTSSYCFISLRQHIPFYTGNKL